MVNALTAANAYQNQMKLMKDAPEASAQDDANQPSFAKLVQSAINEAAGAEYKAEAVETQSLTTGKVELSDLVTAVANAELSLNTVVAVRDRVINAYNDIIKMSI